MIVVTTYLSTCGIFKSSTCHTMVSHLLFTILSATHQSYGLMMKPHSISALVIFFQNSRATCKVLYSVFLRFTYITFLLFEFMAYLVYWDELSLEIMSTILTSSFMGRLTPPISDFMKVPGMTTVTTSLSSMASMIHVSRRYFVAKVGEFTSSFFIYVRFSFYLHTTSL